MSNDYFNPPNSVWPNGLKRDGEGYVTFYPTGTNKVDISTITWPEGDKLVSPFVYQNGELVGFVDTKALTVTGSATTTMNYNHIEADFASISEGKLTVNAPNATVKKFTWSVVDSGDSEVVYIRFEDLSEETKSLLRSATTIRDNVLYDENNNVIGEFNTDALLTCSNAVFGEDGYPLGDETTDTLITTDGKSLESLFMGFDIFTGQLKDIKLVIFDSDLSSLTNGYGMFFYCTNLTSFTSELSSLTNGSSMFFYCTNLTSFTSELSSLTNGSSMFFGTNLTSFTGDLPSLIYGDSMFGYCSQLNSFTGDLSSLTNGAWMFQDCENLTSFSSDLSSLTNSYRMFHDCSKLTSFSSNLSSLTNGEYMFFLCKLDALSVKNIIDTINTYSGKLTLGMGCDNTTEDKDLFAQEVGYADMTSLLATLQAKGWEVHTQHNGRPTTTYSLRRPSENTLPVFVKLEETEKYANYTSVDSSKKFRLNWFHETTGSTEGYTQFTSLEEAVAHFNIKPIERN